MTARILIIDDNPDVTLVLSLLLQSKGYETLAALSGEEGLAKLAEGRTDLILCDIMMPGLDGFQVFKRVRADRRWQLIPFVFLTALSDAEVRSFSTEMGVEAYITKPFNVREVAARIERVLSRMGNFSYAASPALIIDSHLAIDFVHNRIRFDGQELALTPIETTLLSVLVRNKGHIVSSATLIARAWPNEEVYEDNLRVQMSRLRQKLNKGYIHTERGTGYMFYIPDES